LAGESSGTHSQLDGSIPELFFIYVRGMARSKDPAKEIALFEAALDLVMQEGLSGLKMSDLAKAAGVAIGTTYVYFKDKHELVNALYAYVQKRSTADTLVGYDPNAPVEECMQHLWRGYMRSALERPKDAVFLDQYRRSPFLNKSAMEEADRSLMAVREMLHRGIQEGHLKNIRVDLLLAQLSAPMNRFAVINHNGLLTMDDHAVADAYRMAWDSIRA
jgi:AcrR family transcriptional regulator